MSMDGYTEFTSRQAINEEFDVSKDPVEIFKSAAQNAATEVVRLSTKAASESLRFKASCYILDRVVYMQTESTDDDKLMASIDNFRGKAAPSE